VLVPVLAVLLAAFSLFLLGTVQAVGGVWRAWGGVIQGRTEVPDLSVTFLRAVAVMLEACLFIAPLNLAVALGVETLNDLEERVISVMSRSWL
jgi:uncharacterized membrane protein YqhA